MPVSYTHLDVYKRQSVHSFGLLVQSGVVSLSGTCLLYTSNSDEKAYRGMDRDFEKSSDVIPVTLKTVSYTHLDVYKRQGYPQKYSIPCV